MTPAPDIGLTALLLLPFAAAGVLAAVAGCLGHRPSHRRGHRRAPGKLSGAEVRRLCRVGEGYAGQFRNN